MTPSTYSASSSLVFDLHDIRSVKIASDDREPLEIPSLETELPRMCLKWHCQSKFYTACSRIGVGLELLCFCSQITDALDRISC